MKRRARSKVSPPAIRIAAALIDDGRGHILLVRKAGTTWFMQAGGKIEAHEEPRTALSRELAEELGWSIDPARPIYLGRFAAEAANEPGRIVEADLFHIRAAGVLCPAAEIEAAIWVNIAEARALRLAPLTREYVVPLAARLAPVAAGEPTRLSG